MIVVDDVYKRYRTGNGDWHNILNGVSFTIPTNVSVGIIGANGAGKSTLLRLIGGVDVPSRGSITRHCKVSWPMGFGGGLQGSLTGRQNAKFVCRIHGYEAQLAEKLTFMQDFAEIGEAFDRPVKTYSSGMRSRLLFAMSLAFDFDVYISDEVTAVGDESFKQKARNAFANLVGKSSIIMVAHAPKMLKEFCTAGVFLDQGKVHWYDDINDALSAYRATQTTSLSKHARNKTTQDQRLIADKKQQIQEIRKQLVRARANLVEIKSSVDVTQPAMPELKKARQEVNKLRNALDVLQSLA